ncbi:unnamed protein product, partial [Vitis vinifera]|uniref:Uncharacterized protein n=1 Tax=Vitis vinifera TaxID=29760 RepID=D7TUU5_VITVI
MMQLSELMVDEHKTFSFLHQLGSEDSERRRQCGGLNWCHYTSRYHQNQPNYESQFSLSSYPLFF